MLFSVAFHGLRLLKRILSLAVFTLEQLVRDKKLYSRHSAFDTATTVQLGLNENYQL